jgi:hypothetical protein
MGLGTVSRLTDLNVWSFPAGLRTRFNSWIIGFIPSNLSNREVAPFNVQDPSDEVPVPAQQRGRCNEEDAPAITTEKAGESGQHDAIGG